jgi:hypothetical protein
MPAFFEYNDSNIMSKDIKRGDAVKITSQPQTESFWVEINSVDGDTITGSVQNHLIRPHEYNVNDIISFDKKNVREHKPETERFNLTNLSREDIIRLILGANSGMTPEQFDRTLNIRSRPAPLSANERRRLRNNQKK